MYCHCSTCRKLHGSPFTVYGGIAEKHFNWLCDLENIKKYSSSSHVVRYICEKCGYLLLSIDSREDNTLYLNLGLVDSNIFIEPKYQLHNFQQTTAADKTDSTLERGCATTRQSIICRCLKR